jgi:hypothetical protein
VFAADFENDERAESVGLSVETGHLAECLYAGRNHLVGPPDAIDGTDGI